MSMREKIARAMVHADGFYPDHEMEGTRLLPSGTPIFKHPMYQKYADAVLDALMEPTEGMRKAGTDRDDGGDRTNSIGVFQAMIKAAKEGK